MSKASEKLKRKGFNIGGECYIFFNGKIVKAKIIEGDYITKEETIFPEDYVRPFVMVKVDKSENIGGWHNETAVNINKLYKTYEEAHKNRKKIISVKDFIEGDENVHENNILARINVKNLREYNKLQEYIDETYIINDDENHIYDNIINFPCIIIVVENNGTDILTVKEENKIKKFDEF